MRPYFLLALAVLIEGLIFTQLPVFVVPALTVMMLIWISGDLLFPQLVIAALASGIVLDSLRASTYSPWWSLTMLAIGVFVGIWRRYMRERVTDRTYLIRMYAPVAIIGAFAVTFIPYAPILNVLDWRRALIELIIHGILLAVGLMLIRSFSKVYG